MIVNTSVVKTMVSSGWMRSLLTILFITLLISNAKAQKIVVKPSDNNEIYTAVEHSAEFPGGTKTLHAFLEKNLNYPAIARKNDIEGRVYLQFVVEKDGSLSDIKVVRGLGGGCDEEAVRVIKSFPKWNPGMQSGKVVRQQYTMPIAFTLAKNVH